MFVTGCHRSGTSLMASVLSDAMARLQPAAMVSGLDDRSDLNKTLDNPEGFFESRQLRLLNDELLASVGCSWDRPPLVPVAWDSEIPFARFEQARTDFRGQALDHFWVDKDPRLAITYPAWIHILLRRIPLVLVLRHPLEVAASLFSRNGWDLDAGLLLWYLYNHHVASILESDDLLVGYSQILSAPQDSDQQLARHLEAWFDRQRCPGLTFHDFQAICAERVDAQLQRSMATLEAVPLHCQPTPAFLELCEYKYQRVLADRFSAQTFRETFENLPRPLLDVLATQDHVGWGPRAQARLAECQAEVAESQVRLAESQVRLAEFQVNLDETSKHYQGQLKDLVGQLEEHRTLICQQQQQLERLHQSMSWRVTAPFRALASRLRAPR